MHLLTLQFDRIFDVVRVPETRHIPKHTMFGFESGKQAQYGVSVPGWPELKVGHSVTVLLKKAGDWQSVQGWINRSTGELVSYPASKPFSGALVGIIVLVASLTFFSLHGLPISSGRRIFGFIWVAFSFLMMIVGTRQFLHRKRVVNILRNSNYVSPCNSPVKPADESARHHTC